MAAILATLGAAGITIAITEYHPPWPSAWFITGAVLAALGVVCAIWSLILYLARKQARSSRVTRDLARQDRKDRARELEQAVGGQDKGLPTAAQVTDRALLGIHPSIPLPSSADASLSPDMPLYIRRDIDADLRAWITAHQESGGFLLLVGPAACGKTRCAYELAHDMLADWPIFMPSTAAILTEYVQTEPSPAKLIIWLNETQKFLGPNGLTIATVRRILSRPRPAIIIGTIWPQHYDALTSQPGSLLHDSQSGAREILTMIAQRRDMLTSFSGPELARAGSLARRDPRIAEAITEMSSGNLPEILAAAPDLISRWLNAADPCGAAVITAAVVARRCGHPEPLPRAMLELLTGTVLTPAQRARAAPEWFLAALNWARTPVRGEVAPLTPQAATPGVIQGDQVSDVLVQYASRHHDVPGYFISEPTWLLLIDEAAPEACQAIADVAYRQRHDHYAPIAERAIRRAAAAGITDAMSNLGVLLQDQGKHDEAEQWYRKAGDAENTNAMYNLGVLLGDHGKQDEAEQWYRKAAEAGNTGAMSNLGALIGGRGEEAEAEHWFRKAAEAGNTDAMSNLGALLGGRGEVDEAEQWFRKAAEAGNTDAMSSLGALLSDQEEQAEAEQWFRKAADAGHASAMHNLGVMLAAQGDQDQAQQWYRQAADAGETGAMYNLAILLADQGELDEAEQWYCKAAEAGDTDAMSNLGVLLGRRGEEDGAEQWFRKAADAGHASAVHNLGVLLMKKGEQDEAEQQHRKESEARRAPDQ
jgi:TPR repeat protein